MMTFLFAQNKEGVFNKSLCLWFETNERDLPWRKSYDPYHVWISEIMLQQTQVDRVVEYFNRWVALFPDMASLAGASERCVLKAWEGLGYYSRARNIMKAAAVMVDHFGGQVPNEYDELLSLPGIGLYTAGAIMSIAFDRPYSVIDANVERVFARIGNIDKIMKDRAVQRDLRAKLEKMLRNVSPRKFNQALMELGALVCTPASPDCGNCPVRQICRALKEGTVAERPVKRKKQETIQIKMACTIIEKEGKFFIQQRQHDDIWGGLWEFPGGRIKDGETALEAARRELLEETELKAGEFVPFATVTHSYTRYRVTLHSYRAETQNGSEPKLHAARQYRWVTLEGLSRYAFPSGHRQLVARLQQLPEEKVSAR